MKKFTLLSALMMTVTITFAQTWQIGSPNAADVTATLRYGILTISGTGEMRNYSGNTAPWWSSRNYLESVIIEDGVTNIGNCTFLYCNALTSITIPISVTSIGNSAFYSSGLTSINIPNSVTTIGDEAFEYCNALTSLYIPSNVTSIGEQAFQNCSALTSITIQAESVTTIGASAFQYCNVLTSVTIPSSVTTIGKDAFYETQWFNNKPNGIVYINNVLYKYKGTMPSGTTINIRNGTVSISPYAFQGCSGLVSVTIPNSIITIDYGAFISCSGLTEITIPNSVTEIGSQAFYYCTALTSIIIGKSVASIGNQAFDYCRNLVSVTNLNPVPQQRITSSVFLGVNLNKVVLYVPCLSIYQNSLVWKDFGTIIDSNNNCPTLAWEIGLQNTTDVTASLNFADSTLTISGTGAMQNFTSNNQPYSIYRSIIKKVIIQDKITSIGNNAFTDCSNLTSITNLNPTPQTINTNVFSGIILSNVTLNVSCGILYQQASVWRNFGTIIGDNNNCPNSWEIGSPNAADVIATLSFTDSILTISGIGAMQDFAYNGTYYNYRSIIKNVIIQDGVATIGNSAFSYCNNLASITIPESVVTIGYGAFGACSSLKEIAIPKSVTSINNAAFGACSALTAINVDVNNLSYCSVDGILYNKAKSEVLVCPLAKEGSVDIPDGVITIWAASFQNCSKLTSIFIPSSVSIIENANGSTDNKPFIGCSSLASIDVSVNNATYSSIDGVLYNKEKTKLLICPTKKERVIIPNSVTQIEGLAFAWCEELNFVSIPNSVINIEWNPFHNDTNLDTVEVFWREASKIPPYSTIGYIGTNVLSVPAGTKELYQSVDGWKKLNIVERASSLEESTTIEPEENTAIVTWERIENATGYELVIYTDASRTIVLCTVVFDENGNIKKVIRIANTTNNFTYVIDNLLSNSIYYYDLSAKNEDDVVIDKTQGSFLIFGVSNINAITKNNFKIYATDKQIIIENTQNQIIQICDINGKILATKVGTMDKEVFRVMNGGIYVVVVSDIAQKVFVQ